MGQAPTVFQSVFGSRTHEIVEMGEVKKKGSHLDPYWKRDPLLSWRDCRERTSTT